MGGNGRTQADVEQFFAQLESKVRIPMIVTDDSGIVTGDSGDRDRLTHGFAPRATGKSPDGRQRPTPAYCAP